LIWIKKAIENLKKTPWLVTITGNKVKKICLPLPSKPREADE